MHKNLLVRIGYSHVDLDNFEIYHFFFTCKFFYIILDDSIIIHVFVAQCCLVPILIFEDQSEEALVTMLGYYDCLISSLLAVMHSVHNNKPYLISRSF